MTRVKLIATACCTAVLGVLMVMNIAAQDFNMNERTYLTFSGAVELPGVTLQPGTYLFRLADSQSNRHIVQVLSQDEKQIHATILAVPAERLEVTGENVVTFKETAEGRTPALQYWYYPGDKIGHEFVYPKDQAMRIARRTGQSVLSTEEEVASSQSTVSSIGPEGEVTEWKREDRAGVTADMSRTARVEETPAVSATPEPTEPSPEVEPAPLPEPAPKPQAVDTAGTADELPLTASPLPLSGLIGLLSLGGALGLRSMRRRR